MQAGRDDDHGLRNRSFALKDVSARTWIARSLTAEEVRTLADAIDAHYRVAIPLAANAGIRAGELWALRRRDVDLLRGVLHVRQTVKRDTAAPDAPPDTVDRYGREVGPPKNGRPRTITLGKATGDLLTAHLLAPAAGGTGPDALVFQTPGGRAVRHVLFIRKVFRPALKSLPTDKRAAPLPRPAAHLREPARRDRCSRALHQGAAGLRQRHDDNQPIRAHVPGGRGESGGHAGRDVRRSAVPALNAIPGPRGKLSRSAQFDLPESPSPIPPLQVGKVPV